MRLLTVRVHSSCVFFIAVFFPERHLIIVSITGLSRCGDPVKPQIYIQVRDIVQC